MANVNNVSYGKPKFNGAISVAPTSAKRPDDAISPLSEDFKNLGYISADGLTNSNSPESETIKAWGGDTVLVSQTDKPDTFTFKLIEVLNIDVLKEVYGAENVSGTLDSGITIKANAKPFKSHQVVIDTVLNNAAKRIVIPNAVVTEVGDIEYKDDAELGYETTIQALPDDEGNTHYEMIKKAGDTSSTSRPSDMGMELGDDEA